MNYSFRITLKKTIKQLVIAFLAVISAGLMTQYPSVANFNVFGGFTIYALLNMLADWLKHYWKLNIP